MYCKGLTSLLDQVVEKYPQKVKEVFMNFPVRSHKYAETAARAALAADKQGKFWEFHDKLFENANQLNDEKVREIAKELNLNMEQFEKDWQSEETLAKVRSDIDQGSRIGVRGVPAVFINGRQLKQRSLEGFSEIIDKELEKTSGAKQ
ncbi:MAG: DsbA family protein [Desulfobacterales bacterium]|nr:DsbA family protein [Desulfobacterales bacterium]